MGQYWIPVNLTKREYICPHKLGSGLKLWEQLANHPGTGAALIVLCAAQPEARGGGDLDDEVGEGVVGRWAGDRIALVGDYATRSDLPEADDADLIYSLCHEPDEVEETVEHLREMARKEGSSAYTDEALRLKAAKPYTDITALVEKVLEKELGGHFEGEGWRTWEPG